MINYPSYDYHNHSRKLTKVKALLAWEQHWLKCTACAKSGLYTSKVIVGEGSEKADTLLIGEAPGAVEYVQRRPFVGPAGRLMRDGLLGPECRERVFITNILACRPPNNRTPLPEEAKKCQSRLIELVEILQPRLLFAIGRVAEQWLQWSALMHYYNYFLYHPAYVVRQIGNSKTYTIQGVLDATPENSIVRKAVFGWARARELIMEKPL